MCWGPGVDVRARFCRFGRRSLASSLAFLRRSTVSMVATMVSPRRIACFPDCRCFLAQTISCNASKGCVGFGKVLIEGTGQSNQMLMSKCIKRGTPIQCMIFNMSIGSLNSWRINW